MRRFDNFDAMKSWTIDINNEAHSSTSVSQRYDWWNEIYDQVGNKLNSYCKHTRTSSVIYDCHFNFQIPLVVTTQSSSTQRRGGIRSKATPIRPDQIVPTEGKKEQKQQSKKQSSRRAIETKQDMNALPAISETTPHDKTKLADRQVCNQRLL